MQVRVHHEVEAVQLKGGGARLHRALRRLLAVAVGGGSPLSSLESFALTRGQLAFVDLATGRSTRGTLRSVLTLLCIYSLGLMGVISPYATGPAPMYYGSGYIGKGDFWKFGLIFGLIYQWLVDPDSIDVHAVFQHYRRNALETLAVK